MLPPLLLLLPLLPLLSLLPRAWGFDGGSRATGMWGLDLAEKRGVGLHRLHRGTSPYF